MWNNRPVANISPVEYTFNFIRVPENATNPTTAINEMPRTSAWWCRLSCLARGAKTLTAKKTINKNITRLWQRFAGFLHWPDKKLSRAAKFVFIITKTCSLETLCFNFEILVGLHTEQLSFSFRRHFLKLRRLDIEMQSLGNNTTFFKSNPIALLLL